MKKDIAYKWIDALESDEYKQTQGYLKTDNGFCCLGVLCDLYLKEHGKEWSEGRLPHLYTIDEAEAGLPQSVMDWSGVQTNLGVLPHGTLTMINDSAEDFSEVINQIKMHWEII